MDLQTTRDFDGIYHTVYSGEVRAPEEKIRAIPGTHSYFIIMNARLSGVDATGCSCSGRLVKLEGHDLSIETTWHTSWADDNARVLDENGEFVAGPVSMDGILQVSQHGDDLSLRGRFERGDYTMVVTFTRIRGLSEYE